MSNIRLGSRGARPDGSACAQADEALQVYQDMRARGVERTGITYSSLLQACEKAGRWQLALELYQEMHRDGIKPSAAVYNALIGVCGQGAGLPGSRQAVTSGGQHSLCLCAATASSTARSSAQRAHQTHAAIAFGNEGGPSSSRGGAQ